MNHKAVLPWLLSGACVACAGGGMPTPPVVLSPPVVAPPRSPIEPASRWTADEPPALAANLPTGTLIVLRGERYLLGPDGVSTQATTPTPEPLVDATLVPTEGGPVLVGHSTHTVYVFRDPLGPGKALLSTNVAIRTIGAGPGFVAVVPDSGGDTILADVETGGRPKAEWTRHPLQQVAFLDTKRGAILSSVAGLIVTEDGGASFFAVTDAPSRHETRDLRLRSFADAVFVGRGALPRFRQLDLTTRSLGPLRGKSHMRITPVSSVEEQSVGGVEHPMVTWLRENGTDPFAHPGSVVLGAGTGAWLTTGGPLAAVLDPNTLLVRSVKRFGPEADRCRLGQAGATTYALCEHEAMPPVHIPQSAAGPARRADLFVVDASTGTLSLRPLSIQPRLSRGAHRAPYWALVTSRSGGALVLGNCGLGVASPQPGTFCVKQPDETWRTVVAPRHEHPRLAVGPLWDGRLAYLTEERTPSRELRLTLLDASGVSSTRARIPLSEQGAPFVHGLTLSEEVDGALNLMWELRGPAATQQYLHTARPDGTVSGGPILSDLFPSADSAVASSARRPRAGASVLRNGDLLAAWSPDAIRLSTNGGLTWFDPGTPSQPQPGYLRLLSLEGRSISALVQPKQATATPDRAHRFAHLGFSSRRGPEPALVAPQPTVTVPDFSRKATWPARTLSCKKLGMAERPFGPRDARAVEALFPRVAGKETRRIVRPHAGASGGAFVAMEFRKVSRSDPATTLTIKWLDRSARHGKLHTASARLPKGMAERIDRGVVMEAHRVDVADARLCAMLRIGSEASVVCATGGQLSATALTSHPQGVVDFWLSPGAGGEVHWATDRALTGWKPGVPPRVILDGDHVGLRAMPTAKGRAVSLFVTESLAVSKHEFSTTPQGPLSLLGWTPLVPTATGATPSGWIGKHLPLCKKGMGPHNTIRASLERLSVAITFDDASYVAPAETMALWDGKELCQMGVFAPNVTRPKGTERGARLDSNAYSFRWDARDGYAELRNDVAKGPNTTLLSCAWKDGP